jgi:3-hydroxyisobutyrate dehydrogenase-like beta-hydroxyacid dehydrogenase
MNVRLPQGNTNVTTAPKIGFIGLGMMGHGMCKNLLEKGYAVIGMAHRNRTTLEDLLEKGAIEGANPKEIAEQSDVVIICVTGSPQVEEIVYGENGILEACREGQIVIDCTSSEPAMTARLNGDLSAQGVALADAPLARTPVEAEEGRLNAMVGASGDTFAAIKPILETFCENIFHLGDVGVGHKCKLIYNFLAMGQAALIAEALCACAATGVGLNEYAKVVSAGGANSGIFQLLVPKVLAEGDVTGLQFSLANAKKDLGYYAAMTEERSLTGDLGKAVYQSMATGMQQGIDEPYVGDLIRVQSKLNNLNILES